METAAEESRTENDDTSWIFVKETRSNELREKEEDDKCGARKTNISCSTDDGRKSVCACGSWYHDGKQNVNG